MTAPARSRWRVISAAVMAAAVAAALAGCGRGKAGGPGAGAAKNGQAGPSPVSVMVATRGTIRDELELTGTCKAYDEADVIPEVPGKVVRVMADIGQPVKVGQVLAQLDTDLVSKQRLSADKGVVSADARLTQAVKGATLTDRETLVAIAQAQQGLNSAREQLRKAEEVYRLTSQQADSRLEQAKVGVQTAEAQQRDVEAGSRTQEIAQCEAAVRQAESDLTFQKSNYERNKALYDQGAVPEATLESVRNQYEVAQQHLRQSREALSLAREGARREQRRVAALGVDNAREALKQADAGRRQSQIAADDVEVARVGVRQAQETLRLAYAGRLRYSSSLADVKAARAGTGQAGAAADLARATQGKYTVFAPISGIVAARDVNPGEAAGPGLPVMRIVNNNPIKLDCQVSELDIHKINAGESGNATVDGLPGQIFSGRVIAVTPQALKDQRNYLARVEIANPIGAIKAGMFARVKLFVAEKPDVILAGRDCLVERGEDRLAYVVENDTVKVRKLQVGVINGRVFEIISGVRAGEMLVSAGQALLAEGQKVKPVVSRPAAASAPAPAAPVTPAAPARPAGPAPRR